MGSFRSSDSAAVHRGFPRNLRDCESQANGWNPWNAREGAELSLRQLVPCPCGSLRHREAPQMPVVWDEVAATVACLTVLPGTPVMWCVGEAPCHSASPLVLLVEKCSGVFELVTVKVALLRAL